MGKLPAPPATSSQGSLALTIIKELEVEGVGMGVLSDGTPYLTERGLAAFCGVHHSVIQDMGNEWSRSRKLPRIEKIKASLFEQGIEMSQPYIQITAFGATHNAYPEAICMAVLEYYAFESKQGNNSHAINNYRRLARRSFREFIYTQTGYSPSNAIPASWQQFHDRVSLAYNKVPAGYFSIFKELSDMIVTLIHSGAEIGSSFIPDISVGLHWGKFWAKESMSAAHGDRKKYPHDYPAYFPQSMSNPQPAYCYPESALPDFRRWMREIYLPEKLPNYLNSKVRDGALPPSFAELSIKALSSGIDPRRLSKD